MRLQRIDVALIVVSLLALVGVVVDVIDWYYNR